MALLKQCPAQDSCSSHSKAEDVKGQLTDGHVFDTFAFNMQMHQSSHANFSLP